MKTVCAVILEKGILISIWSNYKMIFRKRRLWSDTNEYVSYASWVLGRSE